MFVNVCQCLQIVQQGGCSVSCYNFEMSSYVFTLRKKMWTLSEANFYKGILLSLSTSRSFFLFSVTVSGREERASGSLGETKRALPYNHGTGLALSLTLVTIISMINKIMVTMIIIRCLVAVSGTP